MKIAADNVTEEATEILDAKDATQKAFLQNEVPQLLKHLKNCQPDYWKNYGPYWWGLRRILEEYDPRAYREYLHMAGDMNVDAEVEAMYDYGRDMLNFTAAGMYLEERAEAMMLGADIPHDVSSEDGEVRQYIAGTGFMDVHEE